MPKTLSDLEAKRTTLYRQLGDLGDFRPGIISVRFRRCGKKNCACARKGHPGHGPLYLWNTTRKGKSLAENLRLGPELEKAEREIEAYRQFEHLRQQLVEVNLEICRLRPVSEMEDEELTALKKKLQRRFLKRQKGKLRG